MPSAAQSALARGLAVLSSSQGHGEAFRVPGGVAFTAVLNSQSVPDGIGGRIVETVLLAPRSAFATLPGEGTALEAVDTGDLYRVVDHRPAPAGYINIAVRSAVR